MLLEALTLKFSRKLLSLGPGHHHHPWTIFIVTTTTATSASIAILVGVGATDQNVVRNAAITMETITNRYLTLR
jgi:hypothetical protein